MNHNTPKINSGIEPPMNKSLYCNKNINARKLYDECCTFISNQHGNFDYDIMSIMTSVKELKNKLEIYLENKGEL